jgi:hypothetical protein
LPVCIEEPIIDVSVYKKKWYIQARLGLT